MGIESALAAAYDGIDHLILKGYSGVSRAAEKLHPRVPEYLERSTYWASMASFCLEVGFALSYKPLLAIAGAGGAIAIKAVHANTEQNLRTAEEGTQEIPPVQYRTLPVLAIGTFFAALGAAGLFSASETKEYLSALMNLSMGTGFLAGSSADYFQRAASARRTTA